MRKILSFTTIIFFFFNCYAQKNIQIGSYILPTAVEGEKLLKIAMPFGKSDIIDILGDTVNLKTAGDIFIDVICTDYPSTSDLVKLNQSRVLTFLKRFPFVSDTQLAQVNFLRQLDGAGKEKAETMFHGLVIRYRPKQSLETMKEELVKLEQILVPVENDRIERTRYLSRKDSLTGKHTKPGGISKHDVTETDKDITKELKDTFLRISYSGEKAWRDSGEISLKEAYKKGIISKETYRSVRKKAQRIAVLVVDKAKFETEESVIFSDSIKSDKIYHLPDSTIFKIFERTKWKQPTIIGDVTGSMYPYTAQLLLWLKLHSLDSLTTRFVFFNDGDNTPDKKKKIGKTGGIYFQNCTSFDEVKNLVKETMLKGGGGDCPENNIEALLLAEKEFPENDFQVLIADNWAPIKDISLAEKLTKPVRIVLCGVQDYNININYLNLARQTKGSVHLIEQDLYNLAALHEGEILKIGRKTFKIKDGLFIDMDQLNTGNRL